MVVVDSYFIGEQINEAFNLNGFSTINLKYKTVWSLAEELVDLYSETSSTVLDSTVGEQLVYTILTNLKEENSFSYFNGMEITPAFSKAVHITIKNLRNAGYTREKFPTDAFLNKEKATDIHEILSRYERTLESQKLMDESDVLKLAAHHANKREGIIYILQSNLELSFLEEEFLLKIIPENSYKLPLNQVRGIHHDEKSSLRSISWGEATNLSFIYDLENARLTPNLSYFTAKTEELEVKEVLARIKYSRTKLDENVVFYTNTDKYVTLIYHLSQNAEFPVTFGDGLPISFSSPGRLVSGLLKWIQTNYSVRPFLDLLQEGLLVLGEEAPSKTKISKYLRELQIGWSKERYINQLEQHVSELEKKIQVLESGEIKDYLTNRHSDFTWLLKWFRTIFKRLPEYNITMNYQTCLEGIAYILRNHCLTNSALNEVGRTTLLETLEKVIPYADEVRTSYEINEKIKDLLLSLRVNKSKPKPGHLHVSSYRAGIYNTRRNVFIVGLDNRNFPGSQTEDPILLDRERRLLGRNIPILQNSGHENLYTMLQILAHSEGSVTVSYSNFDINDNRAVSPAHIFLQCYRLATGNKEADFKVLKSLPASLTSEEVLENKDFWNKSLYDESLKRVDSSLLNYYENIQHGLEGERYRLTPEFTVYDGFVQVDRDVLDPRVNKDKQVSAAKLEMLAKCPYSFFLQEVLQLRPIEEIEYNPNKWLDAATRGSLLHSIFENFYKDIKEDKPSVDKHEEKILSIARELIEEQKEQIPPPNERIFQKEVNDILDCCRIFLKEEEAHCETHKPKYFEYTFGLGDYEPAVITLPSGETINVSGKIDRVDEADSGHFHIIDYKTGSTYGYGNKQTFKGGRQLQHMIYALAIEQHLNLESGKVQESAYYFPTVKGLAERVVRKQDEVVRTNGLDILERLIDVIRTGTFTMTDDENDCKFCELKSVCRRQFYNKEVLEMKQTDKNREELQRFKGVRAYE